MYSDLQEYRILGAPVPRVPFSDRTYGVGENLRDMQNIQWALAQVGGFM
jgi:hypothetical protein